MSSSQLTHSIFLRGVGSTTNQLFISLFLKMAVLQAIVQSHDLDRLENIMNYDIHFVIFRCNIPMCMYIHYKYILDRIYIYIYIHMCICIYIYYIYKHTHCTWNQSICTYIHNYTYIQYTHYVAVHYDRLNQPLQWYMVNGIIPSRKECPSWKEKTPKLDKRQRTIMQAAGGSSADFLMTKMAGCSIETEHNEAYCSWFIESADVPELS